MSAPAGFPAPVPNGRNVLRKPSPQDLAARITSPPPQDGRHISDIDNDVKSRVAALSSAPMTTLLQAASNSYNSAKNHLAFRGRRDEAYIEYLVANEIVRTLVTRNPEYPEMVTRNTRNNNTYQLLSKNLRTSQDQFQNIRQIIVQENQRNGSSPVNGSVSSASRPPSQSSGVYPLGDSISPRPSMDSSFMITQSPSKPRPPVRPKPDSLHGNSVDPLTARFAALRNPAPANGIIRMPDAADYQPKRNSLSLKPVGPRDMPTSPVPSIPPKIPLDTQLAANLPRVPDAVFSPARNMQTPSSVDPPRTSARSIIGTGGRSNSYAASVASSRPPGSDYEDGSYFPSLNGQNSSASRRRGIVGLPTETTITAERLFDSLKLYDILLIDVRSRQDFDEGHIDCASILCVEPLQLRHGMSAADIQNSLIISPTKEDQLFDDRDNFNLIVYYDQSTKSNHFLQSPQTDAEENLRILHEALVDYNIDKPLQNSPMLLAGGLDAWVDLLGQPALVITRTYIGKPIRKPSRLPSTLIVGRKRIRQFNPLNAEEEREWAERARSESVNIPDVSEDDVVDEEDNELGFYRTREDFLRRYPEVQAEPESMVTAPTRQSSLPPYPTEPYPRPHSQPSPGYRDPSLSYSHPEMPIRPAPAAPRVSYSGAHDRNSVQHYNVVRSRYLPPPYMSHHDKPANVQLPRTGLVNFGATCYMNSIIQCLSATVPLSRCFRDGSYKKFVQRDNWKGSHGVLPDLYANLIHNLWLQNRDEECIRPITFRRFCARLNAEWGTDAHQDANDFYVFVMEYLHEDLNVYWRNPPAHILSKEEESRREELPMFQAAAIEWDRWSKRERSVISDLFAGQHASKLRCLTCHRTSTTYEAWYNLSVEIAGRPGSKVTLENCLASYCKEERLEKGQEWSCPHCNTTRDATKTIILTKAPPYLVVHLKRFHIDSSGTARKDSAVVDFPLTGLDLGPYMLPRPSEEDVLAAKSTGRPLDQSVVGPFRYNVYGIVEHFGRGLSSGHYIAWINDRARKTWRRFDDQRVTDQTNIRPDGAYLIFYERVAYP